MTDQPEIQLDMTPAIAALLAAMDDDQDAVNAILNRTPLPELVAAYASIALQLGRLAYGSNEALRDALVDGLLTSEVTE